MPGGELPLARQGSGVPVVLVHGTLGDVRSLGPVSSRLGPGLCGVRYSRRHHWPARPPAGAARYTAALHAADAGALLESLGTPAHLVGHSYGGLVAVLAALRYPERVRTLVLVEPAVSEVAAGRPEVQDRLRVEARASEAARAGEVAPVEVLLDWITGQDGALGRLPPALREQALDNAAAWCTQLDARAGPAPIAPAELAALRPPVLLVRGEQTTTYYRVVIDALRRLLPPGTASRVIPGGHLACLAEPAPLVAELLEFLRGR